MRTLIAIAALTGSFAAGQARLPEYSREVLPNGTVLLLMPRAGVPLVHFRVVVKGGAESEPADLAGLSRVTAALLRRGTENRSADEFSAGLDFLGGSFNAGTDNSSTIITAEFLTKDFDRGLDLLSDAVLHPSFPADEVTKEIGRRVDSAKAAKDNAQSAIGSYLDARFFGPDHPYGHPPDERSYGRIERDDIAAYYQRLYRGPNLIVAVTGDFDAAQAKTKVASAFGKAPEGEPYTWAIAPEIPRRSRLLLVDKPDATQTYFQIAQPGIDRKHEDRVVLDLVNTLFGGRFTSMLNDELRVNSGLTYGANSSVERSRLTGAITIASYTRNETTVQAIDLALDVLKRLRENGISAEQLASVKAYVKGLFPTNRLETFDQLAAAMTDLELYGLSRDEIDSYFSRIDAVTLEQANAAARKYYRPDGLLFVLVGRASAIRDQVAKYDENLTVLPITDPGWGR